MSDKTEEQIASEKAAVEAMRNAKSNMTSALERIATLERALWNASSSISGLKNYIAPGAYTYPVSNTSRRCTEVADDAIAAIAKALG